MRLNVYLSRCGIASRRAADVLIQKGKVTVNGAKVLEPWHHVEDTDTVSVNDKPLTVKKYVYFLFYKPKGVVTTLKDSFAKMQIADYIPARHKGIFPVGRLDKHSEGLLLLTNDGQMCFRLTHPKFRVEKEYTVGVEGLVRYGDLQKAKRGVYDEGELLKVKTITIEKKQKGTTTLRVVVTEGKKRHLRRLFSKLGFKVRFLKRVRFGSLNIGNLKPGQLRFLPRHRLINMLAHSQGRGSKR